MAITHQDEGFKDALTILNAKHGSSQHIDSEISKEFWILKFHISFSFLDLNSHAKITFLRNETQIHAA